MSVSGNLLHLLAMLIKARIYAFYYYIAGLIWEVDTESLYHAKSSTMH